MFLVSFWNSQILILIFFISKRTISRAIPFHVHVAYILMINSSIEAAIVGLFLILRPCGSLCSLSTPRQSLKQSRLSYWLQLRQLVRVRGSASRTGILGILKSFPWIEQGDATKIIPSWIVSISLFLFPSLLVTSREKQLSQPF